MHRSRRNRIWLLAVCAGLALSQPGTAASQPVAGRITAAQLDPVLQGSVCGLLQSFRVAFAQFPAAAAVLASVAQALGCSDPTPPGTTTSTVGTTTSTTLGSSTTTSIGPTTTSIDFENTSSTTSTTLLPCVPTTTVPGTVPPTTIPCIPPPPA